MVTVAVARAADTLTLARLALAVLLALVIAGDRLLLGAVILVSGWTTDTMDGILARRAPGMTRLGPWDATIDGMVGAGLMVGLVMGGYAPVAWLIPALVLGGLLVFARSAASGMLLQGMAYGWFLQYPVRRGYKRTGPGVGGDSGGGHRPWSPCPARAPAQVLCRPGPAQGQGPIPCRVVCRALGWSPDAASACNRS